VHESTPDICSTIEVGTEETDGQSVDAGFPVTIHVAFTILILGYSQSLSSSELEVMFQV
jgi:hypothetical protein